MNIVSGDEHKNKLSKIQDIPCCCLKRNCKTFFLIFTALNEMNIVSGDILGNAYLYLLH